jgi:hypothetical protein
MLDDGTKDALKPYTDATGWDVDRAALDFYRFGWSLSDIAAFVPALRASHTGNADTEKAWKAMKSAGYALEVMLVRD